MNFSDIDIIHDGNTSFSSYNGLKKQMRTLAEVWNFAKENAGSGIEIIHRAHEPFLHKIRLNEKRLNIAISNKCMAYGSGTYYFEFFIEDTGNYSNYLWGICLRSIHGNEEKSTYYNHLVGSWFGVQPNQIGMYKDGTVYHNGSSRGNLNATEKLIGVYVDTNAMILAYMSKTSPHTLVYDLAEWFPVSEHPQFYVDKTVVISPGVSMEAEGDVCTLKHNVPVMMRREEIFSKALVKLSRDINVRLA